MNEPTVRELLGRIDERTANIDKRTECIPAMCSAHHERIQAAEKDINTLFSRFWWLIGIIVTASIGAVLAYK